MSSDPRLFPSSLNWTPTTPTLSEAVDETVTELPETVELFAGAVKETVGDVVSGGRFTVRVKLVEAVPALPSVTVTVTVEVPV